MSFARLAFPTVIFALASFTPAVAQSSANSQPEAAPAAQAPGSPTPAYYPPPRRKPAVGATREIGRGAGSIGTGALKGTGELAKGTANGALDLVTLHPIDASASLGRGALGAGKDVSVGTLKGTAQIGKGVGKAIRKIF